MIACAMAEIGGWSEYQKPLVLPRDELFRHSMLHHILQSCHKRSSAGLKKDAPDRSEAYVVAAC